MPEQYAAHIEERLAALEKDMWRGNGKPGLTTRMEVQEQTTSNLVDNMKWIVRLLVGTFITGIGTLVVTALHK